MCALLETKIREFKLPKVSLVKIPVLQSVEGFNIPNVFPYKLAIAFDAVSSADGGIAVTNTYSHTCTGSNLTLTTGAVFTQAPTPTGSATYNSVSMSTGVTNTAIGNTNMYIFYLANPATGANNVVTTGSASCRNYGGSISMTGTNVGSPVGASANANGTSTTPSVSVTTSFANSMLVNTVFINDTVAAQSPSATGTNQTSRYQRTHVSGGVANLGSTQTTTSTGSYTSSWSITGSIIWGSSILEVRELSTTVASRLTLLGVS